jgi:hypothetical protein
VRLQREQVLPQARIKKVRIDLGSEEHRVTLEIQTALTHELAESFGCRELIFAGDVPRSGVDKMILEGSETDCHVHLKHEEFAFDTVVEEIGKYVALLEGDGPKLRFQIKFSGFVMTVADLIEHVKTDPLEIILKPSQLELGLQEETPEVDDSERVISKEQAADTAEEGDQGQTLPSVTVIGVGSHQRKKRTPKPAPPVEDDIMADLGLPEQVQ